MNYEEKFDEVRKIDAVLGDLSPDEQQESVYWAPLSALIVQTFRLRELNGMSQQDVAARMGTRQSVISRFENLGRKPSYDFLARLATALGGELEISLDGGYTATVPSEWRGLVHEMARKEGVRPKDVIARMLRSMLEFQPVIDDAIGHEAGLKSDVRAPKPISPEAISTTSAATTSMGDLA